MSAVSEGDDLAHNGREFVSARFRRNPGLGYGDRPRERQRFQSGHEHFVVSLGRADPLVPPREPERREGERAGADLPRALHPDCASRNPGPMRPGLHSRLHSGISSLFS